MEDPSDDTGEPRFVGMARMAIAGYTKQEIAVKFDTTPANVATCVSRYNLHKSALAVAARAKYGPAKLRRSDEVDRSVEPEQPEEDVKIEVQVNLTEHSSSAEIKQVIIELTNLLAYKADMADIRANEAVDSARFDKERLDRIADMAGSKLIAELSDKPKEVVALAKAV